MTVIRLLTANVNAYSWIDEPNPNPYPSTTMDVAHDLEYPGYLERRRRKEMGLRDMTYAPMPDPTSEYPGYQTLNVVTKICLSDA